jgi:hypothetical protein
MHSIYRNVVAVTLLGLGSISVASAAELNLTAAQKQTIVQSVQSEKGQPAPAGFLPKVGATLPKSVSLHTLPSSVASQVPGAKNLQYVKLDTNEILLIESKDGRVAGIIAPSGTTGAAPAMTSPAAKSPTATAPAPTTPTPTPAAPK